MTESSLHPLPPVAAPTVSAQCGALSSGAMSATDNTRRYLDAADAHRDLNVFITETPDIALRQAALSDAAIARGEARSLEGIPVAIKDNFCTNGIRTTAGSKILHDFVPPYEATVSLRLLNAGAILLGKANMDEFAMGSSTETSYFGPTTNPVGKALGFDNLVPGGSSGGSAAAVAGGLAAAALGSDTGGSIRQPASFCGLVGFKPTYGLCSRWGIAAYASSLDQAGVLAHTVEDAALLMNVIAGHDDRDSTSLKDENIDFAGALAGTRAGAVGGGGGQQKGQKIRQGPLRFGLAKEVMALQSTQDADTVWARAQAVAQDIGAELIEVSVPHFGYSLPAYYIIALSEASSNLARYDGVRFGHRTQAPADIGTLFSRSRAEGFGAEAQRRILLGTYALSAGYYEAYYLRALKVRRILANEFAAAFSNVDVMVMPTTPSAAFEIGAHDKSPVEMYLEDIFTVPVNLAGLPAMSVPIAKNGQGLPLGLQIVGPRFGDRAVFEAAHAIEGAAGFSDHITGRAGC